MWVEGSAWAVLICSRLTGTLCSEGAATPATRGQKPEGRQMWLKCTSSWWPPVINLCLITGNGSVGLRASHGAQNQEEEGPLPLAEDGNLGGGDTTMGHSVTRGSLNHTTQVVSKQGSWFLMLVECCEKGSSQGQKSLAQNMTSGLTVFKGN